MTDFIETYDHALDSDYCDHLIAQFEAGEKHAGATSGGVNTASKVSEDIVLDAYPEWHADLQKIINITPIQLWNQPQQSLFSMRVTR